MNATSFRIVLNAASARTLSRRELTVRAVCARAAERGGISADAALTHFMWLLKYGLVRLPDGPHASTVRGKERRSDH
ncbi:MAG TPA: hypothetical protein VFJ58_07485 [Armatimonadota bacterium]|nr:hypothetical protein [Armatimonadota bacterium]